MAVVAHEYSSKLKLDFNDGDKTISKSYPIKTDAADQDIFDVAVVLSDLQSLPVARIIKAEYSQLVVE